MGTIYCDWVRSNPVEDLHRAYHDSAYGFPLSDEAPLFERLVLEINQAGLSWTTILRKAEAFHRAYDGFEVDRVAAYGPEDIARLMGDAGIIRNRRKIEAAIENARRLQALRASHGGFRAWLDAHHPRDLQAWIRLFKATFVFTGPEIVREFLISTGYLPGAHEPDCPQYGTVKALGAPWAR